MMRHYGFSNDEIIEALENTECNYPKRLTPEAFNTEYLNVRFIHEFHKVPYSANELIEKFGDELAQRKRKHNSFETYTQQQKDHIYQKWQKGQISFNGFLTRFSHLERQRNESNH